MIYGITGKIACGKNFVASIIEERGFEVLDLDIMARDAYKPLEERIKREFGTTDRSEISKIVFSDTNRLRNLERIIYPYLIKKIKEKEAGSDKPVFINGALLKRAGMDKMCKTIIYVEASLKLRFLRASRRSGMSMEEFLKRDKAQEDVDYVINLYDCPVEELVNEQNTHLRTDVNNILIKLGLIAEDSLPEGFDLPELAKEVFEFPKKKKKKKRINPLFFILPLLAVAGLVFLIVHGKPQQIERSEESPFEKPEVAPVVEELSTVVLEPVVIPEAEPEIIIEEPEIPQVVLAQEETLPEPQTEPVEASPEEPEAEVPATEEPAVEVISQPETEQKSVEEIKEKKQITTPVFEVPSSDEDYQKVKDERFNRVINSLPGDLPKVISHL